MTITGNESNGAIALLSAIGGNLLGFMIAPENVWAVQLTATIACTVVLFGIGKGIDVYFKLRAEKREDAKKDK